jgi:DNA mismatch endonuclease, patch repair protein
VERVLRNKLKNGKFSDLSPTRSKMMGAVKGRGNKSTEVRLRLALVRSRIKGWKLHPTGITGKPDFHFPAGRLAVFVDGCFWHGCPKCGHIPKNNEAFWETKIGRNKQRDIRNTQQLSSEGISVLRFWEHELKQDIQKCIDSIKQHLLARG